MADLVVDEKAFNSIHVALTVLLTWAWRHDQRPGYMRITRKSSNEVCTLPILVSNSVRHGLATEFGKSAAKSYQFYNDSYMSYEIEQLIDKAKK